MEDKKCIVCSKQYNLTRHHIFPRVLHKLIKAEIRKKITNLTVTLCGDCHRDYELHSNNFQKKLASKLGIDVAKMETLKYWVASYADPNFTCKKIIFNKLKKLDPNFEKDDVEKFGEYLWRSKYNWRYHLIEFYKNERQIRFLYMRYLKHFLRNTNPKEFPKYDINKLMGIDPVIDPNREPRERKNHYGVQLGRLRKIAGRERVSSSKTALTTPCRGCQEYKRTFEYQLFPESAFRNLPKRFKKVLRRDVCKIPMCNICMEKFLNGKDRGFWESRFASFSEEKKSEKLAEICCSFIEFFNASVGKIESIAERIRESKEQHENRSAKWSVSYQERFDKARDLLSRKPDDGSIAPLMPLLRVDQILVADPATEII